MIHWLRMQVLGMEIPGSNSGKVFFDIFCTPFLPHDDCSIRVSRYHDFILVWCLLYNFGSVAQLPFKLSKGTQPIYTPLFKLFLYLIYPVVMTEV